MAYQSGSLPIPQEEQRMIIAKLDELPPDSLKASFSENDQYEYWESQKLNYQTLLKELKAYFEGREVQLDGLDEYEQELYRAERDFYLALYNLLREAWKDFKEVPKTISGKFFHRDLTREISIKLWQCFLKNPIFESPGTLLCAIIENDAKAQMIPCLVGRYDLNYRKLYRWELEKNKLAQTTNPEINLKAEEEKLYKKRRKILGKEIEELLWLPELCLLVCQYIAMHNKFVKRSFEIYKKAEKARNKILFRSWRTAPAIAWEKGKRMHSVKKGGTYRHS